MSKNNPIRSLSPEVARKIAAGEVIDRPGAIIRELMDNAIDSGASKITVEIYQGGIEKIRVVDNGNGMTKEDLENCARPHATSKISTEVDLLNLSTLGFRGEALASIAAVCRLSIISGGYKMRASITEDHLIEPASELQGTIVQAEGLFENFPARRVFLKRPASEGTICKSVFIEKCLAYPQIAFRFVSDGQIKLNLPENQTLIERYISAMEFGANKNLFSLIHKEDTDWSFDIVIGEPGINRPNKKDILIFVNGRKITEFSLQQAVEYGGQGYFPNGTFPVASVFIKINPSLVDFNIHPAKKEVRFKDISSLHHGISTAVKSHFIEYTNQTIKAPLYQKETISQPEELFSPESLASKALGITTTVSIPSVSTPRFNGISSYNINHTSRFAEPAFKISDSAPKSINSNAQKIKDYMKKVIDSYTESDNAGDTPQKSPDLGLSTQNQLADDFKYIGCTLGTFILAEQNNTLFLIDQHAAHERMIFDSILNDQSKCQTLLIPYVIETKDETEDKYLESIKENLKKIGFNCTNTGSGKWKVTTIQERWKGSENDLEHALLDKKVAPQDIIYSIAAMTACKAAVKDGYKLDDNAAEQIAKGALLLNDPHCPHGRPVYTTITREELFSLVKRT